MLSASLPVVMFHRLPFKQMLWRTASQVLGSKGSRRGAVVWESGSESKKCQRDPWNPLPSVVTKLTRRNHPSPCVWPLPKAVLSHPALGWHFVKAISTRYIIVFGKVWVVSLFFRNVIYMIASTQWSDIAHLRDNRMTWHKKSAASLRSSLQIN